MAGGTLSRMRNIVRAEIDDLLHQMENPKVMVRQMILDMEEALEEAVVAVGRAMVNEKLLERQLNARQEEAAHWQRKAEEAGEEDLARRALQQKVPVEAGDLEEALEESRKVTADLKQQLVRYKVKLDEARARQATLVLRRRVVQGAGAADRGRPVREAKAFARFDRFCQEVAQEETAAEVYKEMIGSKPALDEAFDRLEQKQRVEMCEGCTKANVLPYTSGVCKRNVVQAEDCQKKAVWK